MFRDSMRLIGVALFLFFLLDWALGVFYIPQQTQLTYVNEKYAYNGTAAIVRYGRKSTYYYNFQYGIKHTWANNITVHLVFYESQLNQYKRSFMEIHLKACDMLEQDPYFGRFVQMILDDYNIHCPIPAGMYKLYNLTLSTGNLPNILPFEKGKVEVTIQQLPTHDVITTLYVHLVFYESQLNHYKRSFMEIHLKACDMLEQDPYFGRFLQRILDGYNIHCPIPAGLYKFYNLTLSSGNLPNILPFEKGKVEATIQHLPTHDVITKLYVCFIVKKTRI